MPRSPAPAPRLTRLAQLEHLIQLALDLKFPADAVISRFFRDHPQLGSKDRAFLAEGAWTAIRNRTWYTHLSTGGAGSMHRRAAVLAALDTVSLGPIQKELSEKELAWLDHVATLRDSEVSPQVRYSLPPWLFDRWCQDLGLDEAIACAQAMNTPAPLDLRVNTILAKPADAVAELAAEGITAEPLGIVPEALRIDGKPSLQRTKAFTLGHVEVQDLGSQLLAKLVAPKRGQFIVDLCAGAGGKTLALGAALKNTGRLYALDVAAGRLAKFKPRMARSGLSNVWPSAISSLTDDRVRRLYGKADAVLVDAPCSGLGTLRRNPDLKWRQNPKAIPELAAKQLEILLAAARLLKPGGRLVYATCSTLAEENEQVVASFLDQQPGFARESAQAALAAQRIELPQAWDAYTPALDLRLWPHRTGTDGFYAAVLINTGDSSRGVG
jgi:16S rRNA (cytosine967-C5)-methyltransferase